MISEVFTSQTHEQNNSRRVPHALVPHVDDVAARPRGVGADREARQRLRTLKIRGRNSLSLIVRTVEVVLTIGMNSRCAIICTR